MPRNLLKRFLNGSEDGDDLVLPPSGKTRHFRRISRSQEAIAKAQQTANAKPAPQNRFDLQAQKFGYKPDQSR